MKGLSTSTYVDCSLLSLLLISISVVRLENSPPNSSTKQHQHKKYIKIMQLDLQKHYYPSSRNKNGNASRRTIPGKSPILVVVSFFSFPPS